MMETNTTLAHGLRTIHLDRRHPAVIRILKLAFPDYKGNRVTVETAGSVRFSGTMWQDGYRDRYCVVRFDGQTASIPTEPFLQRSELHERDYPLQPGYAVIRWSQGRYSHVTILVHPDMVPRFLPTDDSKLERDHLIVLVATRSLKASYGGVKNFRFTEARRYTGITLESWERAKADLIDRKLLNKAGAITNDGRNALEASGYGFKTLFDLRSDDGKAVA